MSKIGKQPIAIPEGVEVKIEKDIISFSGKNGALTVPLLSGIAAKIEGGELVFALADEERQSAANWGTIRALSMNAVKGVVEDFVRSLKIEGVGYRAIVEGNVLTLTVGYSHPVKLEIPEGLAAVVEKNIVKITGRDKESVGQFAAKIRAVRKPEPYKGTGIMYTDEIVRRKAGKKVAGSSGK